MKKHLFIAIAVVLAACNPFSGKTTIDVTVTNACTGRPYPGYPVRLREQTFSGFQPDGRRDLDIIPSDAAGKASFCFRAHNGRNYDIWTAIDRPETMGHGWGLVEIWYMPASGYHEENAVELLIAPTAYFDFSINNVNYQDENDTLRLRYFNPDIHWEEYVRWAKIAGFIQEGEPRGKPRVGVPMGSLVIEWEVVRTGQTTTYHRDSMYLKEGGLVSYKIDY